MHHTQGNLCSRRDLERLPLEAFTSCIILADDAAEKDATDRDSQALSTLLLLRDIQMTRLQEANLLRSPDHKRRASVAARVEIKVSRRLPFEPGRCVSTVLP